MGSFVDLSKESFVGKEALVAEQQNGGPSRTLSGLDIDWRWIVNAYLEADTAPNVSPRVDWVTKSVKSGDREVGRASSVTWSPTVSRLIAFGHLETACSDPGTEVTVDWEIAGTNRTVQAPATVTVLPFLGLRRA
jgi:aminomethyltransferase